MLMMRSPASAMFMIVYLVCTVFVVFALVTRVDTGKARAVSETDGAPQKVVHNKRPKPSIPGLQGIAGFFAGGSSTHAKHVSAPLPVCRMLAPSEPM